MNQFWGLLIKGIPIGLSNTLPGVSGGTMALVLQVYERLIRGIKDMELTVLIPVGLGAMMGILLGSRVITGLLEVYPGVIMVFLAGLILASGRVTYERMGDGGWLRILLIVLGFWVAFNYSLALEGGGAAGRANLFRYFYGGAVSSIAMILPGISGGTVLIMLGLYNPVLGAINNFELVLLLVFGLGMIVGLFVFSWILSFLLDRFYGLLMALLTGLILGSIRSVIPTHFSWEMLPAFLLGVLIILGLNHLQLSAADL